MPVILITRMNYRVIMYVYTRVSFVSLQHPSPRGYSAVGGGGEREETARTERWYSYYTICMCVADGRKDETVWQRSAVIMAGGGGRLE